MVRLSLHAASLVSGLLLAGAALADVKDGADAYARGDYPVALKEWLPAAETGDASAMFNLGQMYRLGKGVPKDVVKAESYYRQAAERGHVGAQGNLGTLYYFAMPGSPRVEDALKWWDKAATQGDARSQYMLGVVFYNGKDVPRDPVRAYAWMRLASASGMGEAVEAEKVLISNLSVSELAAGGALAQTLLSNEAGKKAAAAPKPEPLAEPLAKTESRAAPSGGVVGYFVQIGALASRASADRTLAELSALRPSLEGQPTRIEETTTADGKVVYRAQFGPFADRAEAGNLCAEIKTGGADCFIVKAAP